MKVKINADETIAGKEQELFKKRNEVFEKVKAAESAEEVLALAKEDGKELSMEEAQEIYRQLHNTGEISDDELEAVAGGGAHLYGHLVVSALYSCGDWTCKKHGKGCSCYRSDCYSCKHMSYKFPVNICNIH